jgi:DUF4097 and DUF4098 domain-containing protein YvlB
VPIFETLEPISVTLELGVGTVWITATDRTDTTVDVRPTDDSDESDVEAAQRVRVDYTNGVLTIAGPKSRAFDFSVELPSGSRVSGDVQVGDLNGTGRLGECRFKTSVGNVRLERTGPLRVNTGGGHVDADGVAGDVEIHTGTGKVRVGDVEGSVIVKNSNGDTHITAATGDVRVRSANGDITVDRAGAGVEAQTSNGNIRIGEVARGSVELGTSMGDLEIGVAEGTAAWLEVNTGFGKVLNLLDNAERPEASDETVEVRASTSFGAITIRRS